ncbi:MAG: hypothetical protein FWG17_07490 [Desulfovibrionaceae bacterium]|nr:hypothetical protein [Desulfovibrionaceae bacterium]
MSSNNPMFRNFVSSERGISRYVEGALANFGTNKSIKTSKQGNAFFAIMQAAKTGYENAHTSGEKYVALKRTDKGLVSYQANQVWENAETTHLKRNEDDIEKRAKEAMDPKDTAGNTTGSAPDSAHTAEIHIPSGTETVSGMPEPTSQIIAPSIPAPSNPAGGIAPSVDIVV